MKVKSGSEVAQSCPTFSDPMDCSLPGSSVHGIFQARVLEWGAIAFSESVHSGLLKAPGLMLVQAEGMVGDAWLTGVGGGQLASLQRLKSSGCLGQIL